MTRMSEHWRQHLGYSANPYGIHDLVESARAKRDGLTVDPIIRDRKDSGVSPDLAGLRWADAWPGIYCAAMADQWPI